MRAAVVGGGLAGALAAANLASSGAEVVLFEATQRLGGVVATAKDAGFTLEGAVASVRLPDPTLAPLLDRAGVAVAESTAADRRWVATPHGLVDIEPNPKALAASPLLSARGKLRVLCEAAVSSAGTSNETVDAFLRRRFGDEAGRLAAHLAVAGVLGGDARRTEVAAFPQLLAMEKAAGSILRAIASRPRGTTRTTGAPIDGMESLVERLITTNASVEFDHHIDQITRSDGCLKVAGTPFDRVVITTPPLTAAAMFDIDASRFPTLHRADATSMGWVDIAVIGLGGGEVSHPDGFGFLVSPDVATNVLGAMFETGPHRTPRGESLIRILATIPDGATDDELIAGASGDVGRMLGRELAPSWTRVIRRRIPQRPPGYHANVDRLLSVLPSGVSTLGWRYRGVGLTSLAAEATRLAAHRGEGDR